MNSWHSYSQIFNLGHKAIADLLKVPVYVEEKIDGSQFSFGLFATSELEQVKGAATFELKARSKGCELMINAPEKMFTLAVETIKSLKHLLHPGWTYRAEYLRVPKHNTLIYKRTPIRNLIIFDIEIAECQFLDYSEKLNEADRLGLEVVPLLRQSFINSVEDIRRLLDTESILGGQKIEGMVIKPVGYNLFGADKKVLMGKFVSEAFKEIHSHEWKQRNPGTKDIIERIILKYATPARWQKAVIHLRERGLIKDEPQDIPIIMKEVVADTMLDSVLDIQQELLDYAWAPIQRGLTHGLPEWYKELLLKKQFEKEPGNEETSISEETGC